MSEKIEVPLKAWEKALINVFIVSMITVLSMVASGDIDDIHLWKAAMLSGSITFLIQAKALLEKDLNDSGESYTPLMFVKVK